MCSARSAVILAYRIKVLRKSSLVGAHYENNTSYAKFKLNSDILLHN
uniref:Uncharacterized protein n=1 Tax=Anguilla anguilla TaxID=7936 RepID=A0A0E9UH41_ANGAN